MALRLCTFCRPRHPKNHGAPDRPGCGANEELLMSQSEPGRESIESIDQSGDAHEQNPETTTTHGDVAGGSESDVPGGAYNVPPGMAEEVSDEEALPDGEQSER